MNEWNQLENQLHSWIPRGPSPKLKSTLFPEIAEEAVAVPGALGAKWAWLAPVMGCFLVLMVLSGRGGHLSYLSPRRSTNWLAMVASNQSYAAYIVADFHSEQNGLQKEPIEMSLGQPTSERVRPFSPANTNSLIR